MYNPPMHPSNISNGGRMTDQPCKLLCLYNLVSAPCSCVFGPRTAGTKNYVVFKSSLGAILEKYNLVGSKQSCFNHCLTLSYYYFVCASTACT